MKERREAKMKEQVNLKRSFYVSNLEKKKKKIKKRKKQLGFLDPLGSSDQGLGGGALGGLASVPREGS